MSVKTELIQQGFSAKTAEQIIVIFAKHNPEEAWQLISSQILTPTLPFNLHLLAFTLCYPNWRSQPDTAPAIIPKKHAIEKTHLAKFMSKIDKQTVAEFHQWTLLHATDFWQHMLKRLNIVFHPTPSAICDLKQGAEHPHWLPHAKMNIAESCLTAPTSAAALIYQDSQQKLQTLTYGELNLLSNRVANSLCAQGFTQGDPIAIAMPMTINAVAIYLGILKMGGIVVSIPDSFSAEEIAVRLRITQAKTIFTQDVILRAQKTIPLYEKILAANAPLVIVLPGIENSPLPLKRNDTPWKNFLVAEANFTPVRVDPMTHCHILFSSGTTADPKAIPWNHTTAIKTASDAYLHLDVHPDDILAWPTNLGWMMGPWLLFAGLINQACVAIYPDAPNELAFGQFIQNAKVTLLGVVPTLVASWRQSQCMQSCDWSLIKRFSSTGECSNSEDMLYLMSLAHYKPIIEYCGGTEIGGAYITSTLIEKNYPTLFTTPAFGMDFVLLDEDGKHSDQGEVAICTPALGLSTELLNANHHKIYFAHMPTRADGMLLRRHGDEARRLSHHLYCLLGRVDDTMNLSGIKVSAATLERALVNLPLIQETAAVAISPPGGGPSELVIFAATAEDALNKEKYLEMMQKRISQYLNPLFKIYDIVFIQELPKTASNKIMRRRLREIFVKSAKI